MKRSAMKPRTTRLRSTTRLDRRTRVKSVNRARKSREWARAFGSVDRVNWIAGQICVACFYGRNCENHHVINGGKSRKADAQYIVPLCWACHAELHTRGRASFEARYGIDLLALANATEKAWLDFAGPPITEAQTP